MLGTVGEPINPEAWMWYREVHRRGPQPRRRHLVADRDRRHHDLRAAGLTDFKPGSATGAAPRGSPQRSLTSTGVPVALGGGGFVTLTRPWPGMLRGIWGDDERYKETYWNKLGGSRIHR